jgi:hypothetical protein
LQPDWNTPAGRALDALSAAIQRNGIVLERPILVFGSASLQIYIDPAFLSADVDISTSGQNEEIKELVDQIGFGKNKAPFYIEVVAEYIFRPGPNWRERATIVERNGVRFLIPSPLDILLAKLRRLDEKDIRAFNLVLEKTGLPTQEQLIDELRASYDLFYFQMDGRKSGLWENTEKLWPRVYGREIDVRAEVIQPVLDQMVATATTHDYLEELRARLGI